MARALITGILGQDGSYLAEQLVAAGDEVIGLDLAPSAEDSPNLEGVRESVEYLSADLREPEAIRAAIERTGPEEIYHLAAPSFVPDSWDDPTETLAAIAGGTGVILAAALAQEERPRVWVSASSEVFGDTDSSPQNESSVMRPRTPYGVAKLAALGLVRTFREHHGLFACGGILFNHESPRRPPRFLPRKVTRGAAAIALGQQDELVLGDLAAVRDWSDARDIVSAFPLALRASSPGDYVLASGEGHTVADLVRIAFAAASIGERMDECVTVDRALVRPPEAVAPVGNPSRAQKQLGWRRRFPLEETIGEMVQADLRELGGQ